jgi:hypothetical protein
METTFNRKPFRIYKLRAPHHKKVLKLIEIIHSYEAKYKELLEQIDALPREHEIHNDWGDIDAFIKQSRKQTIKRRMEQAILYDHHKEFNWDWPYYIGVVYKQFKDSDIFRSKHSIPKDLPKEYERFYTHIAKIKETYSKDFDELEDTVVEYGGMILSGNIMI